MVGLMSCEDDRTGVKPSGKKFAVEGEGGEFVIHFNTSNWDIGAVINKKGNENLYGSISTLDGKIISENSMLALDGLGQLEAGWMGSGFTVIRDEPDRLTVIVKENCTEEDLSFAIVLHNSKGLKEIIFDQEATQGYTFEAIEYYLQDDDGDSIYWERDSQRGFTTNRPTTIGVAVFVNQNNYSYFDYQWFYTYLGLDPDLLVEVPLSIEKGGVLCSEEKRKYWEATWSSFDKDFSIRENIDVPAGGISYYFEYEWRRRQVSYRLISSNNKSGSKKIVEGKWHELTPTGQYILNIL